MIFSLEVMQAKHGDCLILHYGKMEDPKIMLIDGGPSGIYREVLKPRLLELKQARFPKAPLPLSMVMVSHADDDHINGILTLTDEMANKIRDKESADFVIDNLWFNSFDDIIGNIQLPVISALTASSEPADINVMGFPALIQSREYIQAVIASTGQGRQIRDNANFLTISMNAPFEAMEEGGGCLVRGDTPDSVVELDELEITVVHPDEQRLKELQKQWDKDLKKAKEEGDPNIIMASIASKDKSPFNLSSIVCLVKMNGKKILLTGDGRSDDILKGLDKNGLLEEGRLHVDILKMPHHGSAANMHPEFLQKVTANHYIISANGANNNPDQALLDMIRENVKKGIIHLTNHEGKLNLSEKLDKFIEVLNDEKSELQIKFREEAKASFIIDLLDNTAF